MRRIPLPEALRFSGSHASRVWGTVVLTTVALLLLGSALLDAFVWRDLSRTDDVTLAAGGVILIAVLAFLWGRSAARAAEVEARMHSLAELSPDPIVVHAGGTILYANRSATETFGGVLAGGRLVGRSILELVAPEHRAMVAEQLAEVVAVGGVRRAVARRIRFLDGRTRDLEVSSAPVRYGGVDARQVIVRDVTERRRAELALELERAHLDELFEHSPEAIVLTDVTGRVLRVNREFTVLFGYAPQEVIGQVVDALLAPDDERQAEAAALTARTAAGERVVAESVRRTKDGRLVDVSILGAPIRLAGGLAGIYGIYRDVGARRRAEAALRESEERFRSAVDAFPYSFVIYDAERRIEFVNACGVALSGRAEEDLRGRRDEELFPPEVTGTYLPALRRAAATGEPQQTEATLALPSGTYTILVHYVPLVGPAGRVRQILGITHDITERKRREAFLASEKHVLEMLGGGASLEAVLNALCRTIEVHARDTLSTVLLLEGRRLRHGAAPSVSPEYVAAIDGIEIGPAAGSCGTAAYRRERVVVTDIARDPLWDEYRARALPFGLRACWSAPIFGSTGAVLGTFALYYREPRAPTEDELGLIDRAVHLAAIAIERMRREAALVASRRQLQALSRKLLQAGEEERQRIARDLHDEVGQALTAVKLNLQALHRQAQGRRSQKQLGESIAAVEQTIDTVRTLSFDLRPSVLDHLGLPAAVASYAKRQASRAGLKLRLRTAVMPDRLAKHVEICCFRIAQEAITNVVRHARARALDVHLEAANGTLEMVVRDDGVGFSPSDDAHGATGAPVGLLGMRERAELLGGSVDVTSAPGGGTTVRARLPLGNGRGQEDAP